MRSSFPLEVGTSWHQLDLAILGQRRMTGSERVDAIDYRL
jgi:hypothetical protein